MHVHMHVYLSAELCYCPEPVAVRTSDLPCRLEKLVADWQQAVYLKKKMFGCKRHRTYSTRVDLRI